MAGVHGKTPGGTLPQLPQGNTVMPTRLDPRPKQLSFARVTRILCNVRSEMQLCTER